MEDLQAYKSEDLFLKQFISEKKLIEYGRKWVEKHVARLPEKHKISIILRFWYHFSILEISTVLHLDWSQTDHLINESLELMKESMMDELNN